MKIARKPIQDLDYSAGLISQSCWFIEFKRIIRLLAAGKTEDEIRAECLQNNLLGAIKESRAKRMYQYLWKRACMLDDELIALFANADLATQKLINLVAMLRCDRLFFEFVYDIYREKAIVGQTELTDSDANVFFRTKGSQHEEIESWTEITKKKLKRVYFSCLTDAGLIRLDGKRHLITRVIPDDRLIDCLNRCGDHAICVAIMGVA